MSRERPPEQAATTMPPMGMPPHDSSPPRGDHGAPRMNPDQGAFPPGYGGPTYHHAPYPPQGGYPGYGGQGYPPYGYPPPHMHPRYGAQPPYSYGYHSVYPSQQQVVEKPQEKTTRRKSSPPRPTKKPSSPARGRAIVPRDVELERQRAALESYSVKPMRTAFHFFVNDMQDLLRAVAEDEVRRSTRCRDLDPFLVNTNLNGRLMKAWEDSDQSVRDSYMVKEEADRRRFMADDEVASRHCATLTARARSPRMSEKKGGSTTATMGEEERSESGSARGSTRSPKMSEKKGTTMDEPEPSESESEAANINKKDDDNKRVLRSSSGESPSKKSRVEEVVLV